MSINGWINLKPFRTWCCAILPTVFDESMSYYELLCKVVELLNSTMSNVDLLGEEYETFKTNIENKVSELENYIDNYFNNLDVQEEINNKLDSLVSDGTLSTLLSTIIGNEAYPIFVNSTSAMIDQTKIYILSTNAHIYYYNNGWIDSGIIYGGLGGYTASGVLVTSENYQTLFQNANNIPPGKTYFIQNSITSAMISNLPIYGVPLLIFTFNYSNDNPHGFFQIAIGQFNGINKGFFYRAESGVGSAYNFTPWIDIADKNSNFYTGSNVFITPDNYSQYFSNADLAPLGKMYLISNGINKTHILNLPKYGVYGALVTFNYSYTNSHGKLQFYSVNAIDNSITFLFYRMEHGAGSTSFWSEWNLLNNEEFTSISIFEKFGVIGDSLSVGYYQSSNGSQISRDIVHSWPKILERRHGAIANIAGFSGATSKSWLTNAEGLQKLKSFGQLPIYIYALGANEVGMDIGSINDIGTDNDTLYAYASKIIQEIKELSPFATIFITGILRSDTTQNANNVDECYKNICNEMNCIWLNIRSNIIWEDISFYLVNSHYQAVGYGLIASMIDKKINLNIHKGISQLRYSQQND